MTATPLGAIISDAAEESETESETSTSLNPPTEPNVPLCSNAAPDWIAAPELNIATETDFERGYRKRRFEALG